MIDIKNTFSINNNFVEIPEHIKQKIASFYLKNSYDFSVSQKVKNILTDGEFLQSKINRIIQRFQSQYPEIDEKSYKLLEKKWKILERNFKTNSNIEKEFKEKSELAELVNHSFLSDIFSEIIKNNEEIESFKIYNTYKFSDIKTWVDYTIYIKLKNWRNIAFWLDLKNWRNAEENNQNLMPSNFILITTDEEWNSLDNSKIKTNIEYSKDIYNHISKYKRSYIFWVNWEKQDKINEIFFKNFEKNEKWNFKNLEVFNDLKEYLEKIVNSEVNYLNWIEEEKQEIAWYVQRILDLLWQREEEQNEKNIKRDTQNKKPKKTNPENIWPKKVVKRKYTKWYNKVELFEDIKNIIEFDWDNITNKIKQLAKKIYESEIAFKNFEEVFNSLEEIENNKYKIVFEKKNSSETKYLNKKEYNRIIKIKQQIEDLKKKELEKELSESEINNLIDEYLDCYWNITQKRKKILNQIKFSKQNFNKVYTKKLKDLSSEKTKLKKNKKENNEKIKLVNKKIKRLKNLKLDFNRK